MERNRWEGAIRCLELALHPNTADAEVIAGVNGFRCAAAGIPRSSTRAFARSTPARVLRSTSKNLSRNRTPGMPENKRPVVWSPEAAF